VRALVAVIALALAGAAQADPAPSVQGRVLSWQWNQPHGAARLRLADETGEVREFELGASLRWSFEGLDLPDGSYRYELTVAPPQAAARRRDGREGEARATGATQSGSFTLRDGRIAPDVAEASTAGKKSPVYAKDQLVADDHLVQGAVCVGLDCVNDVDFQGLSLRLAENNTRINFEDTSPAAPDSDWELTANDSASGGLSAFSILQRNTSRNVLRLMAGAPSDGVVVGGSGQLGVTTAAPQQRLHVTALETPTLRLDQNNTGGFTPWIWDVFGNETQFGVRDVTSGTVPFTLASGAPTGTLTLAAGARVGVGTPLPEATLHVMRSDGSAQLRVEEADAASTERLLLQLDNAGVPAIALQGAAGGWTLAAGDAFAASSNLAANGMLQLAANGDLTISGTLSQGSSRALKHAVEAVSPQVLLQRLVQLPLYTWRYSADATQARHLGPMAEDVAVAFGLGASERSLAPGDVAGLAVAATQALREELAARDAELDALLVRLEALEARAGGAR
jgi:hypothetical protein